MRKKYKCPFCRNSTKFSPYLTKNLQGNFFYEKCSFCGGGVLKPELSLAKTNSIYTRELYFDCLSAPVKNPIIQWVLTRKVYQTPLEWTLLRFKRRGRVLDVGCGNGEFLHGMKNGGWESWGSDLSPQAVKRTGKVIQNNKRVKQGIFTNQTFSKKFNLISFWHILEHVRDPRDYLIKAHKILNKGGYVIGEMPNFNSLAFRIFGRSYAWVMVPDHTLYFTEESLEKLLRDVGFRKIKIYNPSRALLNFSISLSRYLASKKIPFVLNYLIMGLSIPFSVLFGLVSSYLKKGEIIRFEAQK